MLVWKARKYVATLIALLTALYSPISDPVKQLLLSPI